MWNYYRDERSSGAEGSINYSFVDSKYFDYQSSIAGSVTAANLTKEAVKNLIPLKY